MKEHSPLRSPAVVVASAAVLFCSFAEASQKHQDSHHLMMPTTAEPLQANILGLNAAVKAERAGEQGSGANGTKALQTAGKTMAQLVRNAQTISALLVDISAAATAQTRGVTEVSASVAQLDHDTQRNAALVEQTTAAAVSMSQMADQLSRAAERFTLPALHQGDNDA